MYHEAGALESKVWVIVKQWAVLHLRGTRLLAKAPEKKKRVVKQKRHP